MADQEFIMTMHTLNKYGVPCVDVTDYPGRTSATNISPESPGTFYLQKSPFAYLVTTKLLSLGTIDEFEPITGIPWTFCFFRNDSDEFGGKGYCDYYSLLSGALIKTVELPFQIGEGPSMLKPAVDINSSRVVYNAVEYEGQIEQYNRFKRESDGTLTLEGRMFLGRGFYCPNSFLYMGMNDTEALPPRWVFPEDIDVGSDTISFDNHGFDDGLMVRLVCPRTPPGGLQQELWYFILGKTESTFKLSVNNVDSINITSQGTGYFTFISSNSYTGYDNTLFNDQSFELVPSKIINERIYSTSYGDDRQTGILYGEELPDLTADSFYKRIAVEKIDMLIGDLAPGTDYVTQVTFGSLLPDNNDPPPEAYPFLVNIFNDQVDDGSGKYTIGSGQIQGIHLNGEVFICVTFDDIRGGQGNQAYQKWYNSIGTFLYIWEYPSFIYNQEEKFYIMSSKVFHETSYFIVMVNGFTKQSYLRRYNIYTGWYVQIELENPYIDSEGYYKLTNRQIIGDKYIMVYTTSGHHLFFDVYTDPSKIVGEVVMDFSDDQGQGYYVIPLIGDDQGYSPITNKLLQLCNSIRHLKMTWAVNQVQVCQAHADWCTAHEVCQHEGPVAGQDASTSLRNRNNAAGIYAGVSENITLVLESTSENEQAQAYANFIESPNHLNGIIRAGNKYMSWACSTYSVAVTQITMGIGMWDGSGYTTEETIRPVEEFERGKLKLYVQNFIWY